MPRRSASPSLLAASSPNATATNPKAVSPAASHAPTIERVLPCATMNTSPGIDGVSLRHPSTGAAPKRTQQGCASPPDARILPPAAPVLDGHRGAVGLA